MPSRKLLLSPLLLKQLPFSLEYDWITNCLEGCFTAFIELGFKAHKFETLASMSFPLSGEEERQKIVRLCCNKLMVSDLLILHR